MSTTKKGGGKQLEKNEGALVRNYIANYPHSSVKDLLWSREFHKMMIKEIEQKLMKLSKEHDLTIPLERDASGD